MSSNHHRSSTTSISHSLLSNTAISFPEYRDHPTTSLPSRTSRRTLSTSLLTIILLITTLRFLFFHPTSPSAPILIRGWGTYNGAGWGSAITQNHVSWQLCQRFGWKLSLPNHKRVHHGKTTIRSELFTPQEYGFATPVCMLSDVLEARYLGGFGEDLKFVKSFLEGGTASEEVMNGVRERSRKCGSIVDDMGSYHDVSILAGASTWIREITAPWSDCEERDELVVHVRWGDLERVSEVIDRKRIIGEEALKRLFEEVRSSISRQDSREVERPLIPNILMENHNTTFLDHVFGKDNYEVVNTPSVKKDVARLSCAQNSIMAQSDFSLMAAHMAVGTVVWYPVTNDWEGRYSWKSVRNVTLRGYKHLSGDLVESF